MARLQEIALLCGGGARKSDRPPAVWSRSRPTAVHEDGVLTGYIVGFLHLRADFADLVLR
jgi:hypothetical protein